MSFYGYQPQAKSYAGIGTAMSQLGAGVGAGIQAAVDASKDWNNMENAIKGIRANYTKYGKTLVEKGALSQDQFQAGLDQLRMPTAADKKNPEGYIKDMQTRAAEAYKIFSGKEDLLLQQQRGQTVQRIGAERAGGLEGLATTGYEAQQAPIGAEGVAKAAGEGAAPGQFVSGAEGGQAPGFQTFQPKFEEQQLIKPAETTEQLTKGVETGLAEEGQAPLTKPEAETVGRIGGLPTRAELAKEKPKEATKVQQDRLALDKEKFAHKKAMDTITKARSTPEQYDKVLQGAINNKFKAKGLSKSYAGLVKTMEQAIDKAEGGVIDQMLEQRLIEQGYDGEMTVPAIQELLPQMEKARIDADRDTKFFEEQIRIIEKTPKPTQIGTHRAARERITEREFPQRLEELGNIRGFAFYGAQDPMISKTGEINISHPKIQEAIKQKLREGITIEEIARGLQEETAFMGTQ